MNGINSERCTDTTLTLELGKAGKFRKGIFRKYEKRGRESEFYNYMADNSINNIGIFLWSRWKVGII